VGDLGGAPGRFDQPLAFVEELERIAGPAEIEADVRKRLDRMRDRVVVLRRTQGLERLARIALGRGGLALLGEQPRLRPVEAGTRVRLGDVPTDGKRLRNDTLRTAEVAAVGQRIPHHRGEANVLEHVRRGLVDVEAALEERDRGAEFTGGGERTGEAFGNRRVLDGIESARVDRRFEELDRVARPPLVERDLAEPGERLRPLRGRDRSGERLLVEPPCAFEIVETKRELRVEEPGRLCLRGDGAGRKVVRADAEPAAEPAQKLERRRPPADLEPRDVGTRATADRGEPRLREAGALTSFAKSPPRSHRVVDMP
jgi:hypothetical protein